jgi:hypothetical protein
VDHDVGGSDLRHAAHRPHLRGSLDASTVVQREARFSHQRIGGAEVQGAKSESNGSEASPTASPISGGLGGSP